MPEENEETNEELDEKDDSVEHEEPTPLPDDPAERATELERRLAASDTEKRRIQRELETEKDESRQQKAGKETWYRKHEEAQAELAKARTAPKKTESEEVVGDILDDPLFFDKETGKKREVGDLVATGVTAEQLVRKVVEMVHRDPKIITTDKLDKRVQQERHAQTQHTKALSDLVTDYPALADKDSALMTAAADIFTQLENERPDLNEADRWELAASRAARKIGYDPKAKTNGNGNDAKERERLRNGQGGPTGGTKGKGSVPQITDEMRKTFKRGNGGVEVPDKVIMDSLKRQAADREARRA